MFDADTSKTKHIKELTKADGLTNDGVKTYLRVKIVIFCSRYLFKPSIVD